MDDAFFLQQACELALESIRGNKGGPFGALVVRSGEVIATGKNCVTSLNDPTAHAEINAIRAACAALQNFRLDRAILYSSCEPCPMCLAAIYWSRIEKVVFANTRVDAAEAGFDDAWIYRELQAEAPARALPLVQLSLPGRERALLEWRDKPDKVPY